jgi:Cu-Zn family superoxide dismutase
MQRGDIMNQNRLIPNAIAIIKGGEQYPNLKGQVKFYEKNGYVIVQAVIHGLPKTQTGFFGFHIHEGKSCTGTDFSDTGNHYNPNYMPHPSHPGDLPPLMFCNNGAFLSVATNRFRIQDIIGRTIVIHNSVDDFTTQPSGNAGKKIACGVIKKHKI